MTRLVRVPLGAAPGGGNRAVDQCAAFKRQLRSALPAAEGAWLVTVRDADRLSVEAVADAHTPGAEAWADRAAELSAEVWETIAARQEGRRR